MEAALVGRAAVDNGKDPAAVRTTYSAQDVVAVLESFDLSGQDIVLVKGGETAHMEQAVRALLADENDAEQLVRQGLALAPPSNTPTLRPSWLEFDADVLANNVRIIKTLIGDAVGLMAVVKADGYGHGAVMVARTALTNGADYLVVASMAEADGTARCWD